VDISDAVMVLNILFLGDEKDDCDDALDFEDDGLINITDGIFLLNFLFLGGPPPPVPYPDCGTDPTADTLACNAYPVCIECFEQEDLDAIIDENLVDTYCIPAGETELDLDAVTVYICPADGALPCGADQTTGCPVVFTTIEGSLDIEGRLVRIHIEGMTDDLPIVVHDNIFGSDTTCMTDITFAADAVVPVSLSDNGDGTLTVSDLGDPSIENEDVSLTSEGGFICSVLESSQDQFVDQLTAQLEDSAAGLIDDLRPEVVGKVVCP
jgi:hypothetical protein